MSGTFSTMAELPATATNGEALAWVGENRRLLDRWETLPDHDRCSMTPETKQRAYRELDTTEAMIRRNMV
jgi:hypothetical protein